jgi:hypothetical protein
MPLRLLTLSTPLPSNIVLTSIIHLFEVLLSPATMKRLNHNRQILVGDNKDPNHRLYSSRPVNAAPAMTMEYFKSATPSSQPTSSTHSDFHPSLLPLLSYYLARFYAQPAEPSTLKQAPIAFRNPRLHRQSTKYSASSARNRSRSSSPQSSLSPNFQCILE